MPIPKTVSELPKYKNGSKAIPKDDVVVQYSAVNQLLSHLASEVEKMIKEGKYPYMVPETQERFLNDFRTLINNFKK